MITDDTISRASKPAAGDRMTADADGIRIDPYWDPSFEGEPGRRPEEWVEELRGLLQDTAPRRPARTFRSACISRAGSIRARSAASPPRAFAGASLHGPFCRRRRLRRVALCQDRRQDDSAPSTTIIEPKPQDLTDLLPRLMHHLDEPVEGPAVIGKFYVAQIVGRARQSRPRRPGRRRALRRLRLVREEPLHRRDLRRTTHRRRARRPSFPLGHAADGEQGAARPVAVEQPRQSRRR